MNIKQVFADSSSMLSILLVLVFVYWQWSKSAPNLMQPATELQPFSLSTEIQLSGVEQTALGAGLLKLNDSSLAREIQTLLSENQYKKANTRLLELAADAVATNDNQRLGNTLLLLGSVAIDSQQLNSAELLLQEALETARRENDKVTMAKTYQQLGRLNIKARALARYAAESYDTLWLARNQMFVGEYRQAEENLKAVIAASTEIRRYGAAADALETMAEFHRRFHDDYQAQLAKAEAARLYATSGQLNRARAIVEELSLSEYVTADIQNLREEVDTLFRRHEQDQMHVSQARDLTMLYHHYRSQGDHRRAWELRIKASRLLGKTSETAVFERGADVLAVLYNSNFAMERARKYLSQADSLFSGFGDVDNATETQTMQALIY